ncbi:MAG: hypothetical protein ACI87J_002249 [Colwellia sp.]|jgi:hypothetical protein
MALYIFNRYKLTVAQLIENMDLDDSVDSMGLGSFQLNEVPSHFTGGSSNTFFGKGKVRAYFYTNIAFYPYVSDEKRNANFHTNDYINDCSKHNSPLVFAVPDGSQWSGYSLGYQG